MKQASSSIWWPVAFNKLEPEIQYRETLNSSMYKNALAILEVQGNEIWAGNAPHSTRWSELLYLTEYIVGGEFYICVATKSL